MLLYIKDSLYLPTNVFFFNVLRTRYTEKTVNMDKKQSNYTKCSDKQHKTDTRTRTQTPTRDILKFTACLKKYGLWDITKDLWYIISKEITRECIGAAI